MFELIYFELKLFVGFFLAVPTFNLIGIFDTLNTKGQSSQIVTDLK